MKKAALLALFAAFSLTSCGISDALPSPRELEELELVRTVGIDLGEGGGVTLTAATVPGMSGGGPEFYTVTADTVAGAAAMLERLPAGRQAIFSHTENIVLGAEAAKSRLRECLDFAERSNDLRSDTDFFVAAEGTAGELMRSVSDSESDVSELLCFLASGSRLLGTGRVFTCRDIASSLSQRGAALMQAVGAEEDPGGDAKTLMPAGLAVIRDGALYALLDAEESRGAAIVTNTAKGWEETVSPGGAEAVLTVTETKCSLTPEFTRSGDIRGLVIDVTVRADVAFSDEGTDTRSAAVRGMLEDALAGSVKNCAEKAVRASQEAGADFMDLFSAAALRSPSRIEKLADGWDGVFPELAVTVRANCALTRTYDLEGAVGTGGKGAETAWKTRIR